MIGFLIVISIAAAGPLLDVDRTRADPGRLNEIRVSPQPPDGFEPAFQRWLIISGDADGRAYDNNEVFVFTGRAGTTSRVLWEITYVNWESREFRSESRVYVLQFRRPPPDEDPDDPTPDPDRKPIRVTYIHERRDQIVPRRIQAALQKLNQQGMQATAIDKDATDGTGEVPEQYTKSMDAAISKGLPALVVEYSDGSLAVSKPQSEQDVLEAVQ